MSTAKATTRNAWGSALVYLLIAGGIVSCASSGFKSGVYTHPTIGYSIPDPNRLVDDEEDAVWVRTSIKQADLAYRDASDTFIAVSSHCEETESRPAVLGRQLLVGLKNRELVSKEEFEFAGGAAFRQTVESKSDTGDVIRTRTVTLVRAGCVVDWVMVAKGVDPQADTTFDQWWQAFEPGGMSSPSPALAEVTP